MKKEQELRRKIRKIIREINDEDSATIKYIKPREADSATVEEPKQNKPSSVTIKEKSGYSKQELLNMLKKSQHSSIDVHIHNKDDVSIVDVDQLADSTSGFGLDRNGNEIEFNYTDIEYVNIDGKRV